MENSKPALGPSALVNLNLGFLGIQIGFALQNANMSRIFQSLGESIDRLPVLWIAAPMTGLLVQPIVGHYSDRTWTRLGRRRPFFLAGAVLAALALFAMPEAGALLFAALLLWVLDASLNISMEPFRAFVGDMLPPRQHTAGYAVQTALIGLGAVAGSLVPFALSAAGVSNEAAPGLIPDSVRYSFWAGGAALLIAVLWTVVTTREYSPAELAAFGAIENQADRGPANPPPAGAWPWLAILCGAALVALVWRAGLEKELYVLSVLIAGYGAAVLAARALARAGRPDTVLGHIVGDLAAMPSVMRRLGAVQLCTWSALYTMWIYTTPVVAQRAYGAIDPATPAYQAGANWVGVMFAVYNGVAAAASLAILPWAARRFGRARTHALCLLCGALGLASLVVLRDPAVFLLGEVGVGIAWASILAMPYAILASALPQEKLGVYMGLFNAFIVAPQLVVATVMGAVMRAVFPGEPVWTMAFAAAMLAGAAALSLRVRG
jgi:maltose/moltooligosaccharide transporter